MFVSFENNERTTEENTSDKPDSASVSAPYLIGINCAFKIKFYFYTRNNCMTLRSQK